MVLFNDLLSFPFVVLNKNWGEGEALLSKNPVPAQSLRLSWFQSLHAAVARWLKGCCSTPDAAGPPDFSLALCRA